MPPKFVDKKGKRIGPPFDPLPYESFLPRHSIDKLQNPKTRTPPKSGGKKVSKSVGAAGKKIKLVWRKKEKPSPPPPWTELPRDITANILHRLGAIEILESAQKVCTTWRSVCKDPAMWRVIDMYNLGDIRYMPDNLVKMCQQAVDRSQGQLVDINLQYFATDELLEYIAERSGKLRCLRLACCNNLSDGGLIEAVKRFPLLEELHIILTHISEETIETVGRSCPLLMSFSFNNRFSSFYEDRVNEEAFAVARSMPELRHLQFMGNGFTNEGLQAIIDGCPHLESLDLRRCYHVSLSEDVGKRCSAKIKHLRYPGDSTADVGFQLDDPDYSDGYLSGDPDFYDYDDYDYADCHLVYDDYCRPDYEDYLFDDDSDYEDFTFFYG